MSVARAWSGAGTRAAPPSVLTPRSFSTRSMGGRLSVHVDADGDSTAAETIAGVVFARVEVWASRLTRHNDVSELARLNADPRTLVPVGPTLAAALLAGREAMMLAPGLVDIALLDARVAAERCESPDAAGAMPAAAAAPGGEAWQVAPSRRRNLVSRPIGMRFDLGGVGKGWIADRALRLLGGAFGPGSAVVDADGDMAARTAAGCCWEIAIDDPRAADRQLAVLRLGGEYARTWGVATSGTSVHRWISTEPVGRQRPGNDPPIRHHLIDPATGLPARTDVVQATVVAGSALHAEAYAKAAVIAGSVRGLALLDRSPVRGAVLLLEKGTVLALPRTLPLLAEGR